MFALTTTHLRFTCEATTPLCLEVENFRAGQNLRGALGQVMTRTYCAETLTPTPVPSPVLTGEGNHAASCPVHWLLAANQKPGEERRGYALVPPISEPAAGLKAGERFEFGLTLFGNALQFLPYFVLAVPEMGRLGIGPGRGKFALKSVWAVNPFDSARECLLAENENLVHVPTLTMNHARVIDLPGFRNLEGLEIHFLTPTRVIRDGRTLKTPEFAPLFASLLKRLDDLEEQFTSFDSAQDRRGGAGRPQEQIQSLHAQAECVRVVESQTRWVEVWSGSTRSGNATWLSGFVGSAVYEAPRDTWDELMPWLLWGQLAQVGKDTVKGNGIMEVRRMGNEG